MDFLGNKQHGAATSGAPAGGAPAGVEKQDYGDKAFGVMAKKAGHPVDSNTGEKITDAARNTFEKVTGKKVDPKISN